MVIFCRKTEEKIDFRRSVEKDHLKSRARQAFLDPKHEVPESEILSDDEGGLLLKNNTVKVLGWHQQSALGHWTIMRTVMPASIWEKW